MIVDDEAALLDVLEEYLREDGFGVMRATDGRTAVEIALRDRPDLVLLDLNLPVLSGLDAFREIRAQSDMPIIMVTARNAEVDRLVGLELGADSYITKPFSPREVVARGKAVLRRTAAATRPSPGREPHDVRRLGKILLDRTAHEVTR